MRFTSAKNMAEIDRVTIEEHDIDETALMETAGQLTARHARRKFLDDTNGKHVVIVTGKGHNGADGLVSARWLTKWNYSVTVVSVHDFAETSQLTQQQAESVCANPKIDCQIFEPGTDLPAGSVYIDALLGTGLSGDPREPYDELIEKLNDRPDPIVSIDIPSGVSGDRSVPFTPCVQADLTVTFGLPKLGMILEPGFTTTGDVIVQELSFPQQVQHTEAGPYHLITPYDMKKFSPKRYLTDHKGDSGRLSVIAGSHEYPGAAFLSGKSASVIGAGLTTIIGPHGIQDTQSHSERELVFSLTQDELLFDSEGIENSRGFLEAQDAFIVGPGLGQGQEVRDGLKRLLPRLNAPVVIDADGLNNFATNPDVFSEVEQAVLTPHPGEAGRLLNRSIREIQQKPLEAVSDLVELSGGHTVILKMSRPIVGHSDGQISVNVTGSPALAKAGSGDVLTGLIGGLLAQGIPLPQSACLGLYLHGASGRICEKRKPSNTVCTDDLIDSIPSAIESLDNNGVPDWFPIHFESIPEDILQWNPFQN